MSLGQLNFDGHDMVEVALMRLREFEPMATKMHPDGFYVADSYGKDSCVIRWLFLQSGCKGTVHYHRCPDPPELVTFGKKYHPETIIEKPEIPFFKQVVEKRYPPTRRVRYCCATHKEHGGHGRVVVTGIRWAESSKRSKRRILETCFKDKTKHYLNPIIEWSDEEVWELIRRENIPYCELYDEGWKRLGCVGCPMGSRQKEEFKRWPKYEKAWKNAVKRAWDKRLLDGLETWGWESWEDMWDWWISGGDKGADPDQTVMFE